MLELFNSIMKFINNHFPRRSGKKPKVETIDASGDVWDEPAGLNERKNEKPNR